MGDLESLALAVCAIYSADCLVVVRRGTALLSRWTSTWRFHRPGGVLANARGALALVNLLPQYPCSFSTALPCLSLTEEGLASWTPFSMEKSGRPAQGGQCFRWEDIQSVSVDRRTIRINNTVFLKARSSTEAIRIGQELKTLKGLTTKARAEALQRDTREAFQRRLLEDRMSELRGALSRLPILAWILWISVFGITPALIFFYGLASVGWWILGTIYLQSWVTAIFVFRGHRKLYPLDEDDRFVRWLSAALAPLSAIRAGDDISRLALERFHPLLLTQTFCSADEFRSVAGSILRDLHFPILPNSPGAGEFFDRVVSQSHERWKLETEKFLTQVGLPPSTLLPPPPKQESVDVAYCPRCLDSFADLKAVCRDCGERPVVPFPKD